MTFKDVYVDYSFYFEGERYLKMSTRTAIRYVRGERGLFEEAGLRWFSQKDEVKPTVIGDTL